MRTLKQKIADMPWVYSTAEIILGGKRYLAAASEAVDGKALIIDPETLASAQLWQGDMGVMNIVQIPGRDQLLAITKFYPIFQSKEAAICLLEPSPLGYMAPWTIREVAKLPFCHRIGIVENPNGLFLLGCQLCRDKAFQEDWTQPGGIFMAPIPQTFDGPWQWTEVFSGLTKNHGLFIENGNHVYISCENGVLLFDMAAYRTGQRLRPQLITTTPTSDIWLHREEGGFFMGAIEPFHGDTLSFYHAENDALTPLACLPIHFGHVVWMGDIFGKSAALIGNRGGGKTLELYFWRTGETVTLDRDTAPTQITVFEDGDEVRILAANHGAGEVALYTVRE